MGQLKPGANLTYHYDDDGVVWSEDMDTNERSIIGWQWKPKAELSKRDQILDNQLWFDIRQEAKTNPALQIALDRVIMMYKLSKDKL